MPTLVPYKEFFYEKVCRFKYRIALLVFASSCSQRALREDEKLVNTLTCQKSKYFACQRELIEALDKKFSVYFLRQQYEKVPNPNSVRMLRERITKLDLKPVKTPFGCDTFSAAIAISLGEDPKDVRANSMHELFIQTLFDEDMNKLQWLIDNTNQYIGDFGKSDLWHHRDIMQATADSYQIVIRIVGAHGSSLILPKTRKRRKKIKLSNFLTKHSYFSTTQAKINDIFHRNPSNAHASLSDDMEVTMALLECMEINEEESYSDCRVVSIGYHLNSHYFALKKSSSSAYSSPNLFGNNTRPLTASAKRKSVTIEGEERPGVDLPPEIEEQRLRRQREWRRTMKMQRRRSSRSAQTSDENEDIEEINQESMLEEK